MEKTIFQSQIFSKIHKLPCKNYKFYQKSSKLLLNYCPKVLWTNIFHIEVVKLNKMEIYNQNLACG